MTPEIDPRNSKKVLISSDEYRQGEMYSSILSGRFNFKTQHLECVVHLGIYGRFKRTIMFGRAASDLEESKAWIQRF
jgi:hypothetical protein